MYPDTFLHKKLQERIEQNALRQLKHTTNKVDFCSNDYIGIVKNNVIKIDENIYPSGSTGSRLLAGNSSFHEAVEAKIAQFHNAETALIFNSGYDANVGLLSCVPQKGDTILYDYLCHASIRDGIRLSFANAFSFAHNDLIDLEKKLQLASGNIFIVTETVFSMDGDIAPLADLVQLKTKYKAHLIIDEAHAIGTIGENGEGLIQSLNLEHEILARVYTYGKACGVHGAAIVGSKYLQQYLINFARSFMYSTALPQSSIAAIERAYTIFPKMRVERNKLKELIDYFNKSSILYQKIQSFTPIQAIVIPGNEAVKNIAAKLQENGLDIRPILYPTVPKGSERLRIILHSFNTTEEVEMLLEVLN